MVADEELKDARDHLRSDEDDRAERGSIQEKDDRLTLGEDIEERDEVRCEDECVDEDMLHDEPRATCAVEHDRASDRVDEEDDRQACEHEEETCLVGPIHSIEGVVSKRNGSGKHDGEPPKRRYRTHERVKVRRLSTFYIFSFESQINY